MTLDATAIDGKKIAEELIARFKTQPKPKGFFGAGVVGEDPASLNFLSQKAKVAEELGIDFRLYKLPSDITTDNLRREIAKIAGGKTCGAFIVQLPLPESINRHYALNAVPKWKDPDLLSEPSLGAFYTGRHPIMPPAVAAVKEIVERQGIPLLDCRVGLIGKGLLIGRPVGFWLQDKVAELMILDSKVKDVPARLEGADIVISGAGVAKLFSAKDLKEGALVIDFGWSTSGGKISGDFDAGERQATSDKRQESPVSHVAYPMSRISYTPTPGGTGPILVAKLFENFYALSKAQD